MCMVENVGRLGREDALHRAQRRKLEIHGWADGTALPPGELSKKALPHPLGIHGAALHGGAAPGVSARASMASLALLPPRPTARQRSSRQSSRNSCWTHQRAARRRAATSFTSATRVGWSAAPMAQRPRAASASARPPTVGRWTAPAIPPSLFKPEHCLELRQYIKFTENIQVQDPLCAGPENNPKLGSCASQGYKYKHSNEPGRRISWAGYPHGSTPDFGPSVVFEKTCLAGCGCCANTSTQFNPGSLPECRPGGG